MGNFRILINPIRQVFSRHAYSQVTFPVSARESCGDDGTEVGEDADDKE